MEPKILTADLNSDSNCIYVTFDTNAVKMKVMTVADEVLEIIAIMLDRDRLQQVDTFVYLGSKLANDGDCADEVKLEDSRRYGSDGEVNEDVEKIRQDRH